MKKKIIGLIMVVMVVVLFSTGCNGSGNATQVPDSEPIISSVDDPQPVVIEDSEVVSEIESESEEISEVEPEEDPMEMFKVDAGWASQRREIGCILHGEDIYAVDYVSTKADEYSVGYVSTKRDQRQIYDIDRRESEEGYIIAIGDFEIPVLKEGDKFVVYSTKMVGEQAFAKTNFYGYGLPINDSESIYSLFEPGVDCLFLDKYKIDGFGIEDMNGNSIEDYFNLQYGEKYNACWYEGTSYAEKKMFADCKVFELPSNDSYIAIEGTLTKNGYMEYDLSSLEPGLYYHRDGGLIEIR